LTGELETAAADSLADLVGGRRKRAPEPGAVCANCGAALQGHYCHVCGQNADTRHRSIWRLILEAVEGLFDLDGRLLRTVPALFFRPGRLARDYIEGRLARHVPPFRTFLIALLLFIFAAEHATHEETLRNQHQKAVHAALLATPQGRAAEVTRLRADAVKSFNEDTRDAAKDRAESLKDPDEKRDRVEATYAKEVAKAQARYARDQARADRVAQGLPEELPDAAKPSASGKARNDWWKIGLKKAVANPDYYWSVLFSWGQRAAILLLPIVGLALALVYRGRKQIYLYDHLLVAMNLLSFSFLANAVGLVLPLAVAPYWFGFVALWTPVYLFQTLRGAYGSSILGAILKTLIVWTVTVLAFTALLTGLLVLAIAKI
jgi:uncharacterized protein DUF3667